MHREGIYLDHKRLDGPLSYRPPNRALAAEEMTKEKGRKNESSIHVDHESWG